MPKRKRPEEKPEDQFKRFVEAAKERGVDDKDGEVAKRFSALARPRAPKTSGRQDR